MAESMFKKATRDLARLRVGMCAPAGAGKTYSALDLAFGLIRLMKPDGRVAVIDSERGSAAKYQGLIGSAGLPFDFDIATLGPDYSPRRYIEALREAARAGFFVVIIDGISQAWAGTGGLLEQKDLASAKQKSGNSWTAWRDITPEHNKFVDAMLATPYHLIATMRAKTEWVQDVVEKDGRKITVPRKIGMAPVQRDGLEYEFDVMFDLDQDSHRAVCTKTRYPQAFPDTFNEKLHFDHVEKLAPLLTNDPVAAARIADDEAAGRAEQERQAREREAAARAEAAARRRPPPSDKPAPQAQPSNGAPGPAGQQQAPAAGSPAPGTTPAAAAPQGQPAPTGEPLTPGVDVPAMDKPPAEKPASGPTPEQQAAWTPADRIADRIAKAKTATELLRIMPDIRKIEEAEEKDLLTTIYQDRKKALIAEGSKP